MARVRLHFIAVAALSVFAAGAHALETSTKADWPKYGGTYGNSSFSSLSQINTSDIKRLAGAWHTNLEGGSKTADQQGGPVVIDGVMYINTGQGNVYAVNAKTGQVKWKYSGAANGRGVGVGEGKVFVAESGHAIVALDQATGKLIWKKAAADFAQLNTEDGVTYGGGTTPAPVIYYNGLIYIGTGGGDGSYRGRVYALHAADGSDAWTFWGTPSPGHLGNETWAGDSWKTGGAAAWMHPAIDPETNTLYWSFGNAAPNTNGSQRAGDNLFSSSIVAIDATTGAYKWHYQTVHHDLWDYDLSPGPVLYDVKIGGKVRKAVAAQGKTGWLYILDRETGKPLVGIDEKAAPQDPRNKTAATQPIPRGDPFSPQCPNDPKFPATKTPPGYASACTFVSYFDEPGISPNGTGGGGDWGSAVVDPRTSRIFIPGGIVNSAYSSTLRFFRPLGEDRSGTITAINGATNKIVWQKKTEWALAHNSLLGTAGNLLFAGQPDGYLLAMDSRTGKEVWRFQTGAGVHGAIVSYIVDGEQYIAVLAGGNGLPYSSPRGDDLWAFKLTADGRGIEPAPAPTPPSKRQPIPGNVVEGSTVNFTVLLARQTATGAESTANNAMYPAKMAIPSGTTVTFKNPDSSQRSHCAVQFFEGLFRIGPLAPSQSASYTFSKPGEYFYNDGCDSHQPNTTGEILVR